MKNTKSNKILILMYILISSINLMDFEWIRDFNFAIIVGMGIFLIFVQTMLPIEKKNNALSTLDESQGGKNGKR